jgi:hypothetical protein
MTRYELLNAAADHIEKNPLLYYFNSAQMPTKDNPKGCMLARIGAIANVTVRTDADEVARIVFDMGSHDFFERVLLAMGSEAGRLNPLMSAAGVAPALRKIAENYKDDAREVPNGWDHADVRQVSPVRVYSVDFAKAKPVQGVNYLYDIGTDTYILQAPVAKALPASVTDIFKVDKQKESANAAVSMA